MDRPSGAGGATRADESFPHGTKVGSGGRGGSDDLGAPDTVADSARHRWLRPAEQNTGRGLPLTAGSAARDQRVRGRRRAVPSIARRTAESESVSPPIVDDATKSATKVGENFTFVYRCTQTRKECASVKRKNCNI
uniref:Uncharacterized protein n=1 Tax=Plectus sambesii TaxID=2011161 RepID=A0A914XNJ1_9BILA